MTYGEKILRFFTGDFCRTWQRRYKLSRLRTVYRVKMPSSRRLELASDRRRRHWRMSARKCLLLVGTRVINAHDMAARWIVSVAATNRTRGRLVGRRRATAISQPCSAARTDSRYAASVILTLHGRHANTPSNLRIPYTLSVKDIDSELAMESHNLHFKR